MGTLVRTLRISGTTFVQHPQKSLSALLAELRAPQKSLDPVPDEAKPADAPDGGKKADG
jgi:hypothetical protein